MLYTGRIGLPGREFKTKQEIYTPVPQNRDRYADNFFSWLYDFNGDGLNDLFVVGFPGTPAYVYENPGKDGFDEALAETSECSTGCRTSRLS